MDKSKLFQKPALLIIAIMLIFGVATLALADEPGETHTVTTFAQLQSAIAGYATAIEDTTIVIGADFVLTSNTAIPGNTNGKTLTIASDNITRTLTRGFSDTSGNNSGLFMVSSGASLILKDIVIDGDKDTFNNNIRTVILLNGATASLKLQDGAVIKNNRGRFGGAILVYGGTLTMSGGEIKGNGSMDGEGGGVWILGGGIFTMSGGEISGNTARWGGGVNVSHGTFTMIGGRISDNDAGGGGGVCSGNYGSGGAFTMSGGKISDNNASLGGGVWIANGTFGMSGGEVRGNTATVRGDGVHLMHGGFLELIETPIISDGVYTTGTLYSQIFATGQLESGALIVIEGSGEANQMRLGTAVASYTGSGSLTDDTAKVFLSYNGGFIGAKSDNTVVWGPALTSTYVTKFAELDSLILYYATADEDMVITVSADFALTSNLTIPGNPNGKTLTITSDNTTRILTRGFSNSGRYGSLFGVEANTFLILENIIIDGNRDIYSENREPIISVFGSEATLKLRDRAILRNNNNATGEGNAAVSVGGTFIMDGGEISGNSGNGVSVNGTFTMNNGKISGNTYRGIYVNGGIFNMHGGEISGNESGGVANLGRPHSSFGTGKFTMHNGEISGNAYGGVYSSGDFTMHGGRINDNTAIHSGNFNFHGGGVSKIGGNFIMNGGEISRNVSNRDGGGVHISGGIFTLNGGEISDNTAAWDGGGVYVVGRFDESELFIMHGGKISGNIVL
jgi:hypothetical protein